MQSGRMEYYVDGRMIGRIKDYCWQGNVYAIGNSLARGQSWGAMADFRLYNYAISGDTFEWPKFSPHVSSSSGDDGGEIMTLSHPHYLPTRFWVCGGLSDMEHLLRSPVGNVQCLVLDILAQLCCVPKLRVQILTSPEILHQVEALASTSAEKALRWKARHIILALY